MPNLAEASFRPESVLFVFDIDNTLLCTPSKSGSLSFFAAMQATFPKDFAISLEDFRAQSPFSSGGCDFSIFCFWAHKMGQSPSPEKFAFFEQKYLSFLEENFRQGHKSVAIGGAFSFLETLSKNNIPLAIFSGNTFLGAKAKLESAGLLNFFEKENFYCSGFGLLSKAEICAPIDYKRSVFFGDTPTDIEVGKAKGGFVVGVCAGRYTQAELENSGAHWCVDDFENIDVLEFITKIFNFFDKVSL